MTNPAGAGAIEVPGRIPSKDDVFREYLDALAERNRVAIQRTITALESFKDELELPDIHQVRADAEDTLRRSILQISTQVLTAGVSSWVTAGLAAAATSEARGALPGLAEIVTAITRQSSAATGLAEEERQLRAGRWIIDRRNALNDAMGVAGQLRDSMRQQLEETLAAAANERTYLLSIESLTESIKSAAFEPVPSICVSFHEAWINAHFLDVGEREEGCIEICIEPVENGRRLRAHVCAPRAAQVEQALNLHLRDASSGRYNLLSLRVAKRVMLYGENLVPGGRQWSWAWFDRDNVQLRGPLLDSAKMLLTEPRWRRMRHFTVDA